ncbi:MAG: transcriptional regulator, XRE family [uncultured bacterium]|nr:MAG: transcriptional regulator, XRE family [uncultured bacterium]
MLGKNIKAFRVKLKLTQEGLAQKAKIPYNTIIKLESGASPTPRIDTVIKVADALNVSIDKLIGRE